jgi:hypothetical protein
MRRTLAGFAILIITCVGVRSAMAGDKIDPKGRHQVRWRENSGRAGQRRQGPQPERR